MGFIIRVILLIITGEMLMRFVDFMVMKDFYDGKFPPDADSLGIPIIGTQIIIAGALLISSPVCFLGSAYFRNWIFRRSLITSIFLFLLFLFLYFVLFAISSSGFQSIFNQTYREQWIDAIALFVCMVIFLFLDVLRFLASRNLVSETWVMKIVQKVPF